MCKCGCNTCETVRGPLLTEGRVKKLISENLSYHIDNNISLMENVFRIGSDAHLSMIKEAKKLYSRGVLDLCEEDEALMGTHLGEFDLYENEIVPLDLPMLEEQMDIEDEIANEEFGMDYDQLGSNEKEWVRDEIDNMSMRESLNESKYEKEETIQQTIDRLKARIADPNDGGNVPFLTQKIKDLEKSLNEATRKDLGIGSSVSKRRAKAELKNPGNDGSKVYGLDKDGKRVHIKSINDVDKFKKFELDADINEAKKAKKKEKKDPPIGKPKRGGSKAYYVYVRDPKTKKVKKVSFGSGGLRAKIRNPKARKAFATRHNCKNNKDRTKAGYWSYKLPRYAPALGLGAKRNTFW